MSEFACGYGVLVGDELVWMETDSDLQATRAVRNSRYPDGLLVCWGQKPGSRTVYQVINEDYHKWREHKFRRKHSGVM